MLPGTSVFVSVLNCRIVEPCWIYTSPLAHCSGSAACAAGAAAIPPPATAVLATSAAAAMRPTAFLTERRNLAPIPAEFFDTGVLDRNLLDKAAAPLDLSLLVLLTYKLVDPYVIIKTGSPNWSIRGISAAVRGT